MVLLFAAGTLSPTRLLVLVDAMSATANALSSTSSAANKNENNNNKNEWVLLVPPKLAKSSYSILIQSHAVARPWHLAGRYGSRTHRHVDADVDGALRIGIPVLSDVILHRQSLQHEALQTLLTVPGVQLVWKEYTASNRAAKHETVDGRIHPERAPAAKPSTDRSGTGAGAGTTTSSATTPTPPAVSLAPQTDSSPCCRFTYAELFAGIGGFGVALSAMGGQCVFMSELEESCRTVLAQNFPTASCTANSNNSNTILHGDIYQVSNETLAALPKVDLLVGGFPCQPFSALGQQPGLQDPGKGQLFLEIVRCLCQLQPAAFLLENVPGLVCMPTALETIVAALSEVGYTVSMEVCSSRGLTATARKRLYLVGLLQTTAAAAAIRQKPTTFTSTDTTVKDFCFPFVPDLRLQARDVIDYENLTKQELALLSLTDEQLSLLNASKHWKPAHLAWPDNTCRTIVSHYGNSVTRGGSQLVPTASGTPRRFTPRECARLMGFPHTFQLPQQRPLQGDMAHAKEQYRMLGNAVCPPVVAALAGAVLAHCPTVQLPPGGLVAEDWVDYGRATAIQLARAATLHISERA